MKSALVLLLAVCALTSAFPKARDESSKEDVDSDEHREEGTHLFIVPLERTQPRRPYFNFGVSDDLVPPPFEHPFFRSNAWAQQPAAPATPDVDDFMTQMQTMLTEMRRQIQDMLHHHVHPGAEAGTGGTGVSVFGSSDDELPSNKTTSTTKVIDGHVVTVNETTYSSGDDGMGAVFRIKVVEVKPSEDPHTEDKPESEVDDKSGDRNTEGPEDREPTTSKSELDEDKQNETNEIPNQKVSTEWTHEINPSANEIDQSEEFTVDEILPSNKENYYDLRGDTRVNNYLTDHQGLVMIEPDAEIMNSNLNYYYYDRVPQKLQQRP